MKNYICINDKKMQLSEETAKRLTAALAPKEEGWERIIGGVRISTRTDGLKASMRIYGYPVRISIINGATWGKGEGVYSSGNATLPGEILSLGELEELISACQELLAKLKEAKQ